MQKRHYLKQTRRHTLKYEAAHPKSMTTDVHSLANQRGCHPRKQKRHYLKETRRHTLKYETANPKSMATDVRSLANQRGRCARSPKFLAGVCLPKKRGGAP